MCQHCCRMEWTRCEPIPYSCPLCPVRQVSDRCHGSIGRKHKLMYPTSINKSSLKHTDLCKDISELYSYVVSAKKRRRRRRVLNRNVANAQIDNSHISAVCDAIFETIPHDDDTWTWKPRFPMPEKVLPVQSRPAVPGIKRD